MKVFQLNDDFSGTISTDGPIALAIGNFDGCHIGHQFILEKTQSIADQFKIRAAVLSFSPSPKEYFNQVEGEVRLFQATQKVRAFEELGIAFFIIQTFGKKFSSLSPESFVADFLVRSLNAQAVVVGDDFRYGCERRGTTETLRLQLAHLGRTFLNIPRLGDGPLAFSSSHIRKLLKQCDIIGANKILGRPYQLFGKVQSGLKLARNLGFPTANVAVQSQLLPGHGVYAGYVIFGDKDARVMHVPESAQPCVINIGTKPTVSDSQDVWTEVHVLNQPIVNDSLYGVSASVYLCHFIRRELKFSGLPALKEQIRQDCESARTLLGI